VPQTVAETITRKAREHADLANPYYRNWREFLSQADDWTREHIEEYQLAELRRIVRHAVEHTRGYRKLFQAAGISSEAIQSLDDVRRLPLVNKQLIREQLDDFTIPVPNQVYVTTGGSTGIPFGFYRTPQAFARELASKAHQYHRIGWSEGDRQLVFRGLPIDNDQHMVYASEFEELRCSSYHLMGEWLEGFYDAACEYKPDWIRCYPSSGFLFATYLKESGKRLPPIKGMLCASENLYDFQKHLFQSVFGCRIFSHYGHYELAALAGFCEKEDTYHVLPQYGLVELLDSGGGPVTETGAIGQVVATSFLMDVTPFIRYQTGDFAVLKGWSCSSCGRPYQVWDRVEGRLQEFILTFTGRAISMTAINMHDDTFNCFQQFQFHQSERGRVTLRYIPKSRCSEAVLDVVRTRLGPKFGSDTELSFLPVQEIPLTKRGKHRFLIQELPLAFHDLGVEPVWSKETLR
jgi:phenylacetate-CoA ligase